MNHLGIINYLSPEGGGDWILAGIIRFLGGRRRDQSPATEYKEGTNEKCLPIGGGNTRILKSPRSGGGGGRGGLKGGFYGDITKILPPSQPPFPTLKRQIMTVL